MFVEGKEGANHHSSILNGDPHSEVYPLEELASLGSHEFIIDKVKISK